MIDRHARDEYIDLIEQFISGRITNFEYERAVPETDDAIIGAIDEFYIWTLYDDFKEHYFKPHEDGNRQIKEAISRCIVFLKSNETYNFTLPPSALKLLLSRLFRLKSELKADDISTFPFRNQQHLIAVQKSIYRRNI